MRYYLSSNCIICHGYKRSVICDLQRENIYEITKSVLLCFNSEVEYESLNRKEKRVFDSLVDKEIFIMLNKSIGKRILPISLTYSYSKMLHNCILEIGDTIYPEYESFVYQIVKYGCAYFEVRFTKRLSIDFVDIMNRVTMNSTVETISLFISFDDFIRYKDILIEVRSRNLRFVCFYVYSSPQEININDIPTCFVFLNQESISNIHCGLIAPFYFTPNISTFTESHHHNTCLNRKLSVDAEGNIRNCPSMPRSFGNIRDTTLEEALSHPDFKAYWHVKKDDITKCKDCEFRYICTDCRAYVDDPGDMYSAPLKCGYDPYTGVWEEWSTHPLKQETIRYYGMSFLRDSAEN